MQIDLLPCSPDDRDFVFRVTEEAMRTYVEEAFGSWDADVQRRRLEESFDPTSYSLIVIDEVRAGILVVEDRPSNLQRFFSCQFLRVNVAARRLYARLGFAVTHSTTDHEYLEHYPPIVDS